jgi:lipopolysaccharide export system permease protein
MTFFVVLFLLLMQFLWRYIDELVGKGLEFKVIGELLVYASSSLVPLALPLAILLSSLMAFGNMGEFYELTAMKSSGISLRHIMFPLIILVIFISIGAFFFSNNVLPVTNLKMKSLLYDVRQQRPEVQITEGVFYNGIENYSLRVNRKDPLTNMLYDIKIYDHTAHKGNLSVTVADSGQMKMTADRRNLVVTLWSGYSYTEIEQNRRKRDRSYPHRLDKFGEQRIIIEMSGFELLRSDESIFRNSYTMLTLDQLRHATDSLKLELDAKNSQFYRTMMETNYFKLNAANMKNRNPYGLAAFLTKPDDQPPQPSYRPPVAASGNPGSINPPAVSGGNQADPGKAARPVRAPRQTVVIDSATWKKPLLKIKDFDSLFNSYSADKKREIMKTALSNTSMSHYMVVNTASNIKFETKYLRRHQIEWHRKFTLSFACLIFLFIGAPLGAIIRKGGLGMPTVISTLLFIMYYIISLTGEKFVRESVLNAYQGMWLSSFILVIAGVFLTYEATNDSAILNLDTYLNWLREKLGLRKGILLDRKTHLTGKFDLIEIPRKELQDNFMEIGQQARECLDALKSDTGLLRLVQHVLGDRGLVYLLEFGVHYNCTIDRIILSKWFRVPYFKKRLAEFPYFTGRLTGHYFRYRYLKILSFILFPVWLIILLHLKIKSTRLRNNLRQLVDLSMGMVNLLNSSAIKIDTETE